MSEDWRIWEVLEKCKVKAEVESAGGLDSNVKDSFSVGQRQLLCLARALLKSSKILCLDECTANIDVHTASLLHNAISSECKGVTVITIAHRISTVLDLDSILVLDRGSLVEQGNPQLLLQDDDSAFSSFVRASKWSELLVRIWLVVISHLGCKTPCAQVLMTPVERQWFRTCYN